MDVLLVVGAIFVEALIAVIAVAAFALLVREYLRRRAEFLLLFAASFGALAAALGLLFIGQFIASHGVSDIASALLRATNVFFVLHGYLSALAAAHVYADAKARGKFAVMATILLAAALGAVALQPASLVVVRGMTFIDAGLSGVLAILGMWLFASVTLAAGAGRRIARDLRAGRQAMGADRCLLNAGLFGILFFLLSMLSVALRIEFFLMVNFIAMFAHIGLLVFGAAAAEHPETGVRKDPATIITRSLVTKAVGLNALLMWLLAFILLTITATYFVASAGETRRASLRRDLLYFTKSHSSYSLSLLGETETLAASPDLIDALSSGAAMPRQVDDYMTTRRGARILRIVSPDGTILYSSQEHERGTRMEASRVLEKALMGVKVAGLEKETMFGLWTVRAGAPVKLEDGTVVGVILDTDVSTAFDFSDYAAVSPIFAAGYGFVAESGEQVFTAGEPIDAVTRAALLKWLGSGRSGEHRTGDGAYFLFERVYATDGVPDGFFYIYVTQSMIDGEVFRIMSTMTIIVVLAVLFMMSILLFGMSVVLRPIRELTQAASRLEKEDYGSAVAYRSADEVGQLARAFDRMRAAIAERTAALRSALREQQDFLDHTAKELRTPLNIFRWTLELMRYGDIGRFNKEQLELLEQMHQTNERLLKLVSNLQDAVRIDQRRLPVRPSDVGIEDVIDEVAGMLSVSARLKNITLHWNRPRKPLPPVRADKEHLKKILVNLVSNAVKYTPQNGHVEIVASVAAQSGPGAGRKGKFIKVDIEDNGIGIPKSEQGRVFSRFFRGSNVTGTEIEGAGLGLYITRRMTELHGGEIWFDSKEGAGTVFTFTTPAASDANGKRTTH